MRRAPGKLEGRAAWEAACLFVPALLFVASLALAGLESDGTAREEADPSRSMTAEPGPDPARHAATVGPCPRGREGGPEEGSPLVLGSGRHAYVEPVNLLTVGSGQVLVGLPTYTWDVAGSRADMVSANAHVAVYLDSEPPRLVERPVGTRAGLVRGVALDEGRWGMLLSEPRGGDSLSLASVARLWYAEYDGEEWSAVEPLPLPQDEELFAGSASSLVRHGSGLLWAVTTESVGAALLYERSEGAWRFERIEDRGVEAVALTADASGAWVALSGLDPGIRAPIKSVRVLLRNGGWSLVSRNPTAEPYTEIRSPSLVSSAAGITVTWTELRGAGVVMARVGLGRDRVGRLVAVDESAVTAEAFASGDGEPAWMLEHVNRISGASELRWMRLDGRRARVARSIPFPFTGPYAVSATGPDAVLVAGPEFSPDPSRPTVRSFILRLSTSCR